MLAAESSKPKQKIIRRDKLDLIADILAVCKDETMKTHIIYKSRINFYQLSRYLKLLINSGMLQVTYDPEHEYYKTTDKGLSLLSFLESVIKTEEL
jgi:predicted transcriptional regulator